MPESSGIEDPADERRVRALVVDLLEEAAAEGHTLLPRIWVIRRARERALQPPCPLGENVLDASGESFTPVVARAVTREGEPGYQSEPAYQVDRLIECRAIVRREVLGRKKGKQHVAELDWRGLVDAGIDEPLPADPEERKQEERARCEKAAALEQLYRSRLSVLIGSAGTGKTTDTAAGVLLTSWALGEGVAASCTYGQGARGFGASNPDAGIRTDTGSVSDPAAALRRGDRPQELQEKLVAELVDALGLSGSDDELGFEESLGGARHEDIPWAFFWNRFGDNPGAAARAESWPMLSPVRAGLVGVDALNRMLQMRFRTKARELAETEGWGRKVPQPVGPQMLLYGDKVINVINQRRRDVWPKPVGEAYLANGDIGIVVGQYKTKKFKGLPWKLEVEFAGELGPKYRFYPGEFGDEGRNPLELAYCLTVHKTQGSEFDITIVVLTSPCWLLSRELLYTALTRHQDRLVILHEGPIAEYRRYAGDEHSEIARRMTNLFADPLPREVTVNAQQRFLEEGLIHRTERGDLVRSKSELVIADKLHARGIDYAYEQPFVLPNGRTRYPDFTIADHARGVTFYWEHLGMLDDPGYRAQWEGKRVQYLECGIGPHEDGGGPEGTLIETRDEPGGRLDAATIASVIDEVILGLEIPSYFSLGLMRN